MSPIHPDQRHRYPADWKAISKRIRFERAGGRCECRGECGTDHYQFATTKFQPSRIEGTGRCLRHHGALIVGNTKHSKVVLTVAHLDHDPSNCEDNNLRAMCQRCHLAYDRDHHARERKRRRT